MASLFGQLIGGTFCTGTVTGCGAAARYLDAVQRANTIVAVMMGATGDRALDAMISVLIVHGVDLLVVKSIGVGTGCVEM